MEEGKFYIFSCPFFWTFVGRFVRQITLQDFLIDDALYFTRTGATFDILCKKGMQGESIFHVVGNGIIIPAQGPKFPWHAPTPWVKK